MEDLVRIFAGLEQQWADSIQRKDLDTLRHRFLSEDFALRISDDASRKIPRSDWLAGVTAYNICSYNIRDLQVRDLGEVAIVSLVLDQDADVSGVGRSGDFFLVDVWVRQEAGWKVAARYSSPLRALPKPPMTGAGGFGRP
jgi:hypothetical protein